MSHEEPFDLLAFVMRVLN